MGGHAAAQYSSSTALSLEAMRKVSSWDTRAENRLKMLYQKTGDVRTETEVFQLLVVWNWCRSSLGYSFCCLLHSIV